MIEKCSKSVAKSVIRAFDQGVVPSKGLGVIAVGRLREISSVDDNLHDLLNGQGAFRFIAGRYGTGKSFMLSLIREHALNKGMVVMRADLSESSLFSGSKKGVNLYRSLIAGMAVNGKQEGAMETVLKKWIDRIRRDVSERSGVQAENVSISMVVSEIRRMTAQMSEMPLYSVFIQMVGQYCLQMNTSNQSALMWLKGEYEQRTLAKRELGVGTIIDDINWFDFVRIWSEFVRYAGYKGLVLLIDEAVSIYKLANSRAREKNYEKILTMYNSIVQGSDVHMAVYMSVTPDLIEHETRGIKSYHALYSRIASGRFVNGYSNPFGVIMDLRVLSREEVVDLLERLRDLHAIAYGYEPIVTEDMIGAYMSRCFSKAGADGILTPRQLSREFIPILDVLYNNPDVTFESIVSGVSIRPDVSRDAEFFPADKPSLEI